MGHVAAAPGPLACPGLSYSERFLDPPGAPPINFVHDQISIYLALFRVKG